jgi:hypothetical protein
VLLALPLLQHLKDVYGRVLEPGGDVVHLEHEDGVGGRGVARFRAHPGVAAARQVQGEQSVLLGDPDPERLAVELPGLSQVIDGGRAEYFVSANMAFS